MALDLFPSRVPFVGRDGRLTPEALRAMNLLFSRVGGTLGDAGVDVFAPGAGGDSDAMFADVMALAETVAQPAIAEELAAMLHQPLPADALSDTVAQPVSADAVSEMVMQPAPDRSMSAAESVTPGGSPHTFTAGRDGYVIVQGGTVSQIDYVRDTAVDTGVVAGLFPILVGDSLTVTYSSAPTVTFIPR